METVISFVASLLTIDLGRSKLAPGLGPGGLGIRLGLGGGLRLGVRRGRFGMGRRRRNMVGCAREAGLTCPQLVCL